MRAKLNDMVGHPRPQYIADLLEELRSADIEVRKNAILKLGQAGDAVAVPELILRLKSDESPLVRRIAALALGHLRAEDSRHTLLHILESDPDEGLRAACITALSALPKRTRGVERMFLKAVREGSSPEQSAAAQALGETGNAAYAPSIFPLLGHENWLVRLAARGALIELRVKCDDAISALEELATSAPDADSARLVQRLVLYARRLVEQPSGRAMQAESDADVGEYRPNSEASHDGGGPP